MEENVVIAPSELIATPIKMALPIKIKEGISIINENPLGVLEKLGKYEFIYDYKVPSFLDSINYLKPYSVENTVKAYPKSNTSSGFYNFDGDGTGGLKNIKWEALFPQPVRVNSEPQVGTFSKGNIVNVLRFDGYNAIIQNPNFVEPDPTAVKTFWSGLNVDLKNQKEFTVPKDYLRKADDNLAVTVSTGILYGANTKPQPVYNMPPVKTIPINPVTQTILEENVSFVLNKDFQYISGYGSSYCSPDGMCTADMSPKSAILKAGTKVTGRLFREVDNTAYKLQMGAIMPPSYKDYLAVKGYGHKGSIDIPIEYLTKELPTNVQTNNGVVVPAKDNNKNILMIVGAFLLGYALFGKDTPTT